MRDASLIRLSGASQSVRAGVVLGLAGLLMTTAGCQRKAGGGQTVAVVNGEPITASELKLELSNLPPQARERSRAQVLQAMIDRRLLADDARKAKRDKAPAYVLQARRMGEVMLAQQTLNAFAQSSRQPVSQTEINTYLDAHPQIGNDRKILLVNQIQFPTPAKPILDAMQSAKTMPAVIALLNARDVPFQRGRTQMDTALLPDAELQRIAANTPGEAIVVINGAATVVSEIVQQQPAPLSAADQATVARNRITTERSQAAVKQQTDSLRQAAKISYADGYSPKAGTPK